LAKATFSRNVGRLQRTASKSATAMRQGHESTEASLHVVRKRIELGIDALHNPAAGDYVEFSRMLPEKISALSSASMIFSEKSAQLGYQILRHLTNEMARAAAHSRSMMAMPDPVSALTAQATYVADAAQRMLNASLLLSSMGATLVNAAGAPSHRIVMANAKRLG
jgi:hypothetical protein